MYPETFAAGPESRANQFDGAGPVPKVHQDPRLGQRFVSRIVGKCFNVGHTVENP